jgi:hypothetical protein
MALCQVPRMFQIWAEKQVMDIAPANRNRPWERSLSPLCSSCAQVPEHALTLTSSFAIILGINELIKSIDLLNSWAAEVDTDPVLWDFMVEYAKGRGRVKMEEICQGRDT